MEYKEFAESLGLRLEFNGDECSVEGPTEKVIAFRDEVPVQGTGWYDLDDRESAYFFLA